jgi:[protein-PII] uridylyltransferase
MSAIPAISSSAHDSPSSPQIVETLREQLRLSRASLRQRFDSGDLGQEILREQSLVIDRHIRAIWKTHNMPASLALIAVGGYGRAALFPHSDVDVLILLPQRPDAILQNSLEAMIGAFWDSGIEVGHSVRTIEDCIAMAQSDVTVQTTMLESRLVTGNRALFHRFTKRFSSSIDPVAFLRAKRLEQHMRHQKQQESNLEPSIKECPGGLRDLNTILWISRAAGMGRTWQELCRRGLITDEEARSIKRNEKALSLMRIRLHHLAGRREDRLLFDHQDALARAMGFEDGARRASEQLMQRVYQTAKSVTQINTILLQNLALRIDPPPNRTHITPLNERFVIRGELLSARDENLFEKDPTAIFESFRLLQMHPELKGIGAVTLRALWRARKKIDPACRRNPVMHRLFIDILKSPARMIRELRRMHQFDILGSYIPAFGRVIGQMQHDLYHVYTVDEHILKVVRNLRRFAVPELAHEFPLSSRLHSEFDKPELLYLAGLFHDIAKGRGGDHSTLGKLDALRFCRLHGLSKNDSDLVAWLVEQHLVMSSTAQKKDLSDPAVIAQFAEIAGNPRRLTALYLLTVADIRGTSPKVWNAWKGKLLEDLYHATLRVLAGEMPEHLGGQRARQEEARARLRLYAIPDASYADFWRQLDTAYFLRHDAQEIAWHTRLLHIHTNSSKPVVRARLSNAGEGLQVMVYVADQKELFSRICSFFESISFNIVEAKIHTTRHGYALDTFQVNDASNRQMGYRDIINYIEFELEKRLIDKQPLPPLSKPRLNRQLKHFPITPDVQIEQAEKDKWRILSITAGDRPGLLSRVSRTLSTFDISLHLARINTLGARAEDVFVVSGSIFDNAKETVRFEESLLDVLRT